MQLMPQIHRLLLCVGVSVLAGLYGSELDLSQQQLALVNEAIQELQTELAAELAVADEQQSALAQLEKEMAQVRQQVKSLSQLIEQQQAELTQLGIAKAKVEKMLAEQQDEISTTLLFAYQQRTQPLLKLLLSGQRPEDWSRQLHYLSTFTSHQQQQLQAWRDKQTQLEQLDAQQTQTLAQLRRDQLDREQQLARVQQQQRRRNDLIAQLTENAGSLEQQLQQKQQEQERLNKVIADFKARLQSLPLEFPATTSIKGLKGQLPWPVKGELQTDARVSGVSDQGWLLAAEAGESVHSIYAGRLVFADYFKSQGLLAIIDHGDGVWSLYGRNQLLLKSVGSWIQAGEKIAEVGRSGGYNKSALYFELREHGEPQNPARWLAAR